MEHIMASKNKQILKTNHSERKTYNYSTANVNLTFTLRTDIVTERKDFLELLKTATKELDQELQNETQSIQTT